MTSSHESRNEQGKCVRCDKALTAEEIEHPEKDDDGDVICEQCWRDLYLGDCARCGESVDKSQLKAEVGQLIGIWRDAPACGADELKAGYYIVLRWPFFLDGMITGSFFDTALRRVADLDDEGKGAAEEETCLSAPMCHHCQGEVSRAIVAARFTGSETQRREVFEDAAQECRYYLKHQNYPSSWDDKDEFQRGVQIACENLEKIMLEKADGK